ncbi:uncharacterized protein LOC108443546 [Pygocentrus nattereri]|uniref:uncharacterized protein LOC108443546 n=1 Tax=Pygocentrus nattereri TaxID=42514 RepID=UPI0008142814|nr:uncharacterized protein LOC108443546 [Pygocentrus nattereri]XP_017579797.1 uncharacterized protein LOC108443546 [Pygocentrus nattereri]
MASSTVKFTWCACRNYKIQSKDTHDKCLLCLGIQHAKEAVLEYGKCPHCAKMDWSTCIKRLTKVQEVMHQETQQKKHEAAQSGVHPKLEPVTPPAAVTESKPMKMAPATPTTSRTEMAAPAPSSSTVPVMFTILSPSPGLSEPNAGIVKGTYVSRLALQHTSEPAPSVEQANPPPMPSTSHKRHHSSRCRSCCKRHGSRGRGHRRKHSPSSSSSSSWTTSDSSCESVKGKRARRESRRSAKLERQNGRLLEMVQQKLEAQQRAMQMQWSMLERRIDVLEKKGSSALTVPVCPNVVEISQAFSLSHVDRGEQTVSNVDSMVTGSIDPSVVVKQEESPVGVSCGLRSGLLLEGEGETDSQPSVSDLPTQEVLGSKELQNLISRAAKHLGIEIPASPNCSDPPLPTMVPEFEDFVQITWSNPASSKPFRPIFAELYKLHECQSPAYDHMPQINGFMSAIFQAVRPSENKEHSIPPEHWKFTEALVEKAYQTAGMLAKTANYLRYMTDYQKRLLEEISEEQPSQRLPTILSELKLIGQFTFQLSSHQAELSGRIMAASVAVRRQIWMAKTNYTDSLKATVADLPFVVGHSVGENSASSSGDAMCRQET